MSVLIDVLALDERETAIYTVSFVDLVDDGAGGIIETPIPKTDVASITMTLYVADSPTQPIVNSRDGQNVLDANNGQYGDTDGVFTWAIQVADTKVHDATRETELHRALIRLTTTSGAVEPREVEIRIRNLQRQVVT